VISGPCPHVRYPTALGFVTMILVEAALFGSIALLVNGSTGPA
jgi:hypothetical protein